MRAARTLLAGFAAAATLPLHAVGAEKADLVKAAMVEKIARFIEWPGAAPGSFALCVTPGHPQLEAVREYYQGTSIANRPVTVRVVGAKGGARAGTEAGAGAKPPAPACSVAFLAPADLAQVGRWRAAAVRGHFLLIAEGDEAAAAGVHVAFYAHMGRLRLEVNRKALEAAGLKASFRLLEVARVVE